MLHILSVCVCSFSYPACNAHAPFYIVNCGLSDSAIFFPHYLTNSTILEKQEYIVILIVSITLSRTFPIPIRTERNVVSVYTSSCKVPVFLF